MRVYLDYLDGAMGITGTSEKDAKWAAASANMPRWAYLLHRIGAILDRFANRYVTDITPVKRDY